MDVVKISDYEVEVSDTEPAKVRVCRHQREFIEQQLLKIQAQKAVYDALQDAAILECQNIIAEMDRLGILLKPKEVLAPKEK
jgi:hypothetical protein